MSYDDGTKPRTIIPSLSVNPPNTPPDLFPSTHAYFTSIPWTAALLNRPDTHPFIVQARNPHSRSFDQFFTTTLNHDNKLPHMLSFFSAPTSVISDKSKPISEVTTLYYIGHDLTSGPGMLHGGMLMALVDEGMGAIPEINMILGKTNGFLSLTGELKIRFSKPVLTGEIVVVRAWLDRAEGRKSWVRCEVLDKEGSELARCESLWISPKEKVGREML